MEGEEQNETANVCNDFFINILLLFVPVMAMANEEVSNEESGVSGGVTLIVSEDQLIELLNDTGTQVGVYQLQSDFTINTNELRHDTVTPGEEYSFNGVLDGGGYTITILGESGSVEGYAPLFDTLRGSVRNLNVVFEGDVRGTTIAYDILDEYDEKDISLSNICVTVKGSVLPAEHDYLDHKGSLLTGSSGYENWYIHFRGQPVYLSTGFAWYIWGASLSDITLNITNDIGTVKLLDKDTTATGFAYLALLGDRAERADYKNININIGGDIQSYTGDPATEQTSYICAYASAYGFATGTFDAGMLGGKSLTELRNVTIQVGDIVAEAAVGGATASGFAMQMAGHSYYCSINSSDIRAVTTTQVDSIHSSYTGQALATGFSYITSMAPTTIRGDFEGNTVNVSEIYAQTNASNSSGCSYAIGFVNELAGASGGAEPRYHDNHVVVADDITARANKGAAIASGFVRYCKNSNDVNSFYNNSVSVGGDIHGYSVSNEGSAAGFVYNHYASFSECKVLVDGSIISESGYQSIAGGFTTFGHLGNKYSIKDCDIHVIGSVRADRQNSECSVFSGGLIGYVNGGDSNSNTYIERNLVRIDGEVVIAGEYGADGLAGLLVGYVYNRDDTSLIVLTGNAFTGKEALVGNSDNGNLYTYFIGQVAADILTQSGNSVFFMKEDGRQYSSVVEPVVDSAAPNYVTLWRLTDIQDIILRYDITATAGENGSISPSGTVSVTAGEDQTFTITPDRGYHIQDVLVDGVSVGAVSSYTFADVAANHTIAATFTKDADPVTRYRIEASAGEGGSISPEGIVRVSQGGSQTFTITPDQGYKIEDVLVDGESVGPVSEYTFKNVRAWHTITVTFAKLPADPGDTGVSDWLDTEHHMAYLNGYPGQVFGPDRDMTRAEAAQMFYNLLLDKDVAGTASFTDVSTDAWYAEAVNTLASLGMIQGVEGNRFQPDRAITRAEFTAIAMRFTNGETTGENRFSDVNPDQWFYDVVVGAVQYGWINGYEDGTFRPESTIKRAEVAAITNRMLARSADEAYVDAHASQLRLFADVAKDHWAYYTIVEASNTHDYQTNHGNETWKDA